MCRAKWLALLVSLLPMPTVLSAESANELPKARRVELLHMLTHDCGACHGARLDGGLGPPLRPADLSEKADESLVATVLWGSAGTPMAGWRALVTESEARWLIRYLKQGERP